MTSTYSNVGVIQSDKYLSDNSKYLKIILVFAKKKQNGRPHTENSYLIAKVEKESNRAGLPIDGQHHDVNGKKVYPHYLLFFLRSLSLSVNSALVLVLVVYVFGCAKLYIEFLSR